MELNIHIKTQIRFCFFFFQLAHVFFTILLAASLTVYQCRTNAVRANYVYSSVQQSKALL